MKPSPLRFRVSFKGRVRFLPLDESGFGSTLRSVSSLLGLVYLVLSRDLLWHSCRSAGRLMLLYHRISSRYL